VARSTSIGLTARALLVAAWCWPSACALLAAAASAQQPSGPPAAAQEPVVVGMLIEGERRYTEAQIAAALGQRLGAPLDREAVKRGVDVLWRTFHTRAEVSERAVPGGVELRVSVEEMNVDLEPRFVGNAEIDLETLQRWAQLEDRGELYLYQAERVRQRLIEGYKREGYYFVEVEVVRRGPDTGPDPAGALPDVIFEIREGPLVNVDEVVVRGNVSMPERGALWFKDGLVKLASIQLSGPWLFDWNGAEFVEEVLDADLLAMREVYRDRGYLDAIVEVERLEFSDDRSWVTVHVAVDEGQPYTVDALAVEAVERTWNAQRQDWDETPAALIFPADELLALCQLAPGKRYERFRQQNDAQALRERYGREGYLSHPALRADGFEFLEPRLTFDPGARRVGVTYRLAQGKKRYVREVLFAGTLHTRDRVVRREVDVMPGDVADLTKIRRSLGRLNSTGYFRDELRPQEHRDPVFTFRATPDPNWVDLEYQVEEGTVVNFQVQGGVDSNDGLFGRVALTMRNFDIAAPPESLWSVFGDIYDKEAFHGAGQRLDLEWSPGTVQNSASARFVEPDLFRSHFDRWSLELGISNREREQEFYDEDRFEKRVRFGREFGRELALFLGYTHTDLEVSDLEDPAVGGGSTDPTELPYPDSIYQELGENVIAGPTFDVQFRDLDNVLSPRNGMTATWRNGLFGGPFGGDFQYVKSGIDLDWYLTPGSGEELLAGFHFGVAFGIADAFGDTSETPYTERCFLGGTRNMRGWEYRGVGPNRGENALGGETSLYGTAEYRIPIYTTVQPGTYKQIETFRLTLFSDAGVLDPDPWTIDPGELRWSVGFGVGMVTPIPVTLNFGFPIRSGDGDREQVFSFQLFSLAF
jgi:outer membrane protein insertion porin family